MDFDEPPELRVLRESARRVLADASARLGPVAELDRKSWWATICEQGWSGLAVPERFGGSEAPLSMIAVVLSECARVAMPTTLRSTICAGLLIDRLGAAQQRRRWLPRLAGGAVGAVAPGAVGSARLARSGGSKLAGELAGELAPVPDLDVAELVVAVLPGPEAGRSRLCVLEPSNGRARPRASVSGFPVGHLRGCDLRPDQCDVGPRLAPDGQRDAADLLAVLVAADLVGAAEALLTRTVHHVRTREQFGRPLGAFQAVQHHVSDMAVALECSRLLVADALAELDAERPAHRAVAAAKAHASRAGIQISLMAHQLHGAIGYVTESDLYRLSQRVQADSLSGGTATEHLQDLAVRYRSGPARTLELDALDGGIRGAPAAGPA